MTTVARGAKVYIGDVEDRDKWTEIGPVSSSAIEVPTFSEELDAKVKWVGEGRAPWVGLDLASGPDRMVVTCPSNHLMRRGDRLRLYPSPRSVSHFVGRVISDTAFEVTMYVRPSKGYRKHIRRMKARKR